MKALWGEGRLSSAALVVALGIAACGTKDPRPGDSVTATPSGKTGDSAAAAKDSPKSTEASARASSDVDPENKIDVGAILGGNKEEETGALPVSLDGIKNDAPLISTKPPTAGSEVTWIDAGSDSIPNFGFAKQNAQDLLFLEAPDKSGGVVFTTFRDQAEGGKKVETIISRLKLKDTKWKKPKAILLPTDKIPALIGGGHGTDSDGKGVKVVYAFIKGDPNLLAIAGVNDSASTTIQDEVFATIGGIKRKAH